MDFTSSYYSTNESAGGIDVCVSVVMGQLGTNITLELNTLGGTARGEVITCKCKLDNTLPHYSLLSSVSQYI